MIPDELLDWYFAMLRREAKKIADEMNAEYGDRLPGGGRFVYELGPRLLRPTSTGELREDER